MISKIKNSRIKRVFFSLSIERDGYPSDPNHIFLTSGASYGVSLFIQMLIKPVTPNNPSPSGILIPIPQYPLYTATLAQHSGTAIPYLLDESSDWSTSPAEVEAALAQAKKDGVTPKALVIINPGNPTGALLNEATQEALVKICEQNRLVLMADEVYQVNLHRPLEAPFTSFKKIVRRLNSPVSLISYHSISKGVSGECGRRGGYFECTNVPEDVIALIYKIVHVHCAMPKKKSANPL
jgi:alanine transaminase